MSTRLTSTPQEKSSRQLGPNSFIATQLSSEDSFLDVCRATWNSALAAVMRPESANEQGMMSKPRSSITSSSDEAVTCFQQSSSLLIYPSHFCLPFRLLFPAELYLRPRCFFSVYLSQAYLEMRGGGAGQGNRVCRLSELHEADRLGYP